MSLAKVVFVAVDYIYNGMQNRRKLTKHVGKDVLVCKDIVFDESCPKCCKLDTYVKPKEHGKYPVILEIHGGGFVAGDKKFRRALSRWYADKCGAFVVNANYGLGPKYQFPQPFEHLVGAMNWIYDNAEKLNLDLDRILVSGDSAGGFYAALLASLTVSPKMQEYFGLYPKIKFQGLNLNCGIYDIEQALNAKTLLNISHSICKDFAGIPPEKLPQYEHKDYISPIYFVNSEYPKTFVTYAEQDFFCKGQGERLVEKLKECGVYCEYYASTEFSDNHTFSLIWTTEAAKANNEKMTQFINKLFNGEI